MGRQRDDVVSQLRDLLVSGEFQPGQVFSENVLAQRFGTTRTPVREAMAILASEGLIEQTPQVGASVRVLTNNETAELVRVRIAIEQLVVEELCNRSGPNGIGPLQELLDRMYAAEKAGDKVAFLDADTEFHCMTAEVAGYTLSANILRRARDRMRILGMTALLPELSMVDVLAEHQAILDAIKAKQPAAAKKAVKAHMARTAKRLRVDIG